jgi:hypothetical protein
MSKTAINPALEAIPAHAQAGTSTGAAVAMSPVADHSPMPQRKLEPGHRPEVAALAAARAQLAEADPVMRRLIEAQPSLDPRAWLSTLPEMDTFRWPAGTPAAAVRAWRRSGAGWRSRCRRGGRTSW